MDIVISNRENSIFSFCFFYLSEQPIHLIYLCFTILDNTKTHQIENRSLQKTSNNFHPETTFGISNVRVNLGSITNFSTSTFKRNTGSAWWLSGLLKETSTLSSWLMIRHIFWLSWCHVNAVIITFSDVLIKGVMLNTPWTKSDHSEFIFEI